MGTQNWSLIFFWVIKPSRNSNLAIVRRVPLLGFIFDDGKTRKGWEKKGDSHKLWVDKAIEIWY